MNYFEDLTDVVSVACCCMMFMLMIGTYYEAMFPKPKQVRYVECSLNIVDMASKFNITLMDKCEVKL